MLRLIESHCTPILTYGIEVIFISDASEKSKIRKAYNSAFRRIFGYRTYESVRELQGFLLKPTWEELVEIRKQNFQHRLRLCGTDSPVQSFSIE